MSSSFLGVHGNALVLREQRLQLISANIANADTPGYKARDMDFGAALQAAMKPGATPAAMQAVAEAARYQRPSDQPSLDGNTVEMATEQTAFAENALAYRSSLSVLQGRINTLTRALKGE